MGEDRIVAIAADCKSAPSGSVVRVHLFPLKNVAEVAQLIEHQPSKLRAAGLSPVFRSNETRIANVAQG